MITLRTSFSACLIAILLFYSCIDGKKELNNFTKDLIVKKNILIPIENDIHYKSWQIHTKISNDTTYIARKNYYGNSIIVYNLDTKEEIKRYKLKTEGPNEVTKFDSAAFLEYKEGEFVIANGYSQIYMVKNDSVIFKKYFDDTDKGFGNMMNGFNKNLPILKNDNVFIFRKPPIARQAKKYYSYNLLVKFNLKTKELKECNVKYPESYRIGECWGFPHLRQSFTLNNKNQLIFSFPIDSNIYIYSLDNDILTKVPKKTESIFNPVFKPMPDCNGENAEFDIEKYQYDVAKSARYESISYDKYRDVYYRIVLFPSDNLSKKNIENIDPKISIMVLDSEFNLLTEKMLPKNTYDFEDFFVSKEGFWVSTNNVNNPNFNEDVMSFDLFTLKDL